MPTFDATPEPEIIDTFIGLNLSWATCISEWLDNAIDAGATAISASYQTKARTVSILDNGSGFDGRALFQVASIRARKLREISKYGSGGTISALNKFWRFEVFSIIDDVLYHAYVDWEEWKRNRNFEVQEDRPSRATVENTPAELLAFGQGTLLRGHVRKTVGQRVMGPRFRNLQELLGRRYKFGLRDADLDVILQDGDGTFRLEAPPQREDQKPFTLAVVIEDHAYLLQGRAGYSEQTRKLDSVIDVGFGPRIIFSTGEGGCFRSPDGSRAYTGEGVSGEIQLDEEWKDFLNLTKTDFREDTGARVALDAQLFKQLEPLLKESSRASRTMRLEEIDLQASVELEDSLKADVPATAGKAEPRYTWTKKNKGEEVPEIEVTQEPERELRPDENGQSQTKGPAGPFIAIVRMPGTLLDPLPYDVAIDEPSRKLTFQIDEDFPGAEELASLRRLAIPAIAAELGQRPEFTPSILPPRLRDQWNQVEDDADRAHLISGHLIQALARNGVVL